MNNAARIGFLKVQQEVAPPYSPMRPDIAIGAISWESRSTSTLHMLASAQCKVHLLRFKSTEASVELRKSAVEKIAKETLSGNCLIHLLKSSSDFLANSAELDKFLQESRNRLGRPLKLLIDISCIPKRYMLFILGVCFRKEYVSSIRFLYSKGKYILDNFGPADPFAPIKGLISEGEWTSVQVPYLESSDYAPNKKDLVISLGAETTPVLPILERMEPNRLKIILINNNILLDNNEKFSVERKSLSTIMQYPNSSSLHFPLFDVIGVASAVSKGIEGATTCFAVGPKPHALALGIAALAQPNIDVVCRIPASYSAHDVEAEGTIYSYTIEDRFEPHTYLTVPSNTPPI